MSMPSDRYELDFKKHVYTALTETLYLIKGIKAPLDFIDNVSGFYDLIKQNQMSKNETSFILDTSILQAIIAVMQSYAENSAPKCLSYMSMFNLKMRAHNQHGVLAEQVLYQCKKALLLLNQKMPHQTHIQDVVTLLESVSKQHCHEQDDFPEIVSAIAAVTRTLKNWNFKDNEIDPQFK